jgi:hypothetical protein
MSKQGKFPRGRFLNIKAATTTHFGSRCDQLILTIYTSIPHTIFNSRIRVEELTYTNDHIQLNSIKPGTNSVKITSYHRSSTNDSRQLSLRLERKRGLELQIQVFSGFKPIDWYTVTEVSKDRSVFTFRVTES